MSRIEFTPIDAGAHSYPPPRVSPLPIVTAGLLTSEADTRSDISCFLSDTAVLLKNARSGIALALQNAGIGEGDEVLLPAYHCGSMVEPIAWTGATPVCYRVTPELGIDAAHLESQVTGRSKAILFTHYFGFAQDTTAVARLCQQHDLISIEDCAHRFFHPADDDWQPDYRIASLRKFLPGPDGGALIANDKALAPKLMPAATDGLVTLLKDLYRCCEEASRYQGLPWLQPIFRAIDALRSQRQPLALPGTDSSPEWLWFRPQQLKQSASPLTRWLLHKLDWGERMQRRRMIYQRYLQAFSSSSADTPLLPHLPEAVTPYMFPLLIEHSSKRFPALKQAGVPIWRWDQILDSGCPIASRYRTDLLQLPCHAALTDEQVEWIIQSIEQTAKAST